MQLEFDISDLGEPKFVFVYGETALRVTDAIISVLSLEPRITNFIFSRVDSSEEGLESQINSENSRPVIPENGRTSVPA
jgi:hypothetical protein